MKKKNPGVTGVININKPSGITSHDVVDHVRKCVQQRRVGHTGTLDPIATGVLPICLGHATRIARFLMAETKAYLMALQLGTTTDSQDITGKVLATGEYAGVTQPQIAAVLDKFRGEIEQVPPMISAKHHKGKRLYELAREGIEVERDPIPVTIKTLELRSFTPPEVEVYVVCGKGTYIRTLCHDIGKQLGCGATMSGLVRTQSGGFCIETSVDMETLQDLDGVTQNLVSMDEALNMYASIELCVREEKNWMSGQGVRSGGILSRSGEFCRATWVRVKSESGQLLGVGRAVVGSELLDKMGGDLKVVDPEVVLVPSRDS